MIEFAPFMLFILGLDPDRPGEVQFKRVEKVYATPEACNQEGDLFAKASTIAAAKTGRMTYEYRCIQVPKGEEIERAWREFNGQEN